MLLEQSDLMWDEEAATSSQTIRAKHLLLDSKPRKEVWSFEDAVTDCPVDLELTFHAPPRITDLDNDGIKEVWLMTRKACKGDISPSEVEVVLMDTDGKSRRLLAEQLLVFPDGTTFGGTYDPHDFYELPEAYQAYAVEYLLENYRFEYVASLPDSMQKKYSWNPDGLVVYAAPSLTADSIDCVGYGKHILVEKLLDGETVEVTLYQHDEDKWLSDEYLKVYRPASRWLQVKHGIRSGFVLNTHLAPIPPPDTSHASGLIWEEYLKSLSAVIFQEPEGQTEDFCARNTLHFENGKPYKSNLMRG